MFGVDGCVDSGAEGGADGGADDRVLGGDRGRSDAVVGQRGRRGTTGVKWMAVERSARREESELGNKKLLSS